MLFFVDIINLQQWVQNIRLWFMESRPLQLKKAHDGSMSQGCVDVRLPASCVAPKHLYAENLSFIFCLLSPWEAAVCLMHLFVFVVNENSWRSIPPDGAASNVQCCQFIL